MEPSVVDTLLKPVPNNSKPCDLVEESVSRRYVGEEFWLSNEEDDCSDLVDRPVMRRKRAEYPSQKLYNRWDRNLSNQRREKENLVDDSADLDRDVQDRALKDFDRTACWLLPCSLFFRLLNILFCTYRLEIGLRGKLKKALGDPTKMLRQNVYGLLLGILIGFGGYILFMVTFPNNPHVSTLLSAYVMLFSVYGIAFSEEFRCVGLLTLPYLAASRVRWLFMLYASALSVVGPGLNFLHNSGNFRNAIACILAQVSTNMLLIQKLTAAPFSLLKNQLESLIAGLNQTLLRMRFSLKNINFSLFKMTKVMEKQSRWIVSLVEACGDPVALRNQCLSFMNNIYFNCKASLGSFEFICGLVRQFAADTCTGDVNMNHLCNRQKELLEEKMNIDSPSKLNRKMENILDILGRSNLTLRGSFDQYEQLTIESDDTVISILQKRMDTFINTVEHGKLVLAWILVAWTLLTMVQLVIQAAIFRKSWILSDRFDNVYITPAFVQQEKRAISQGLVPTVPLIRKEKKTYKKFSSFTWTISEKKKAFRSFIVLFMWMSTLLVVLFADYAMYQVLLTVTPVFSTDFSTYGAKAAMGRDYDAYGATSTQPVVTGTSSYANIIRALLGMLNPIKDLALNVDATACRPTATPPNRKTTIAIFVTLIFTVFSIFFEVYVLRLRHLIMIWYYPNRGIQRAAWLRTHIRNNRGLFHRLIHKFKAVDVKPGRQAPNVSRLGKMMTRHPVLRSVLGLFGIKRIMCAFCGEEGNPKKKAVFEDNFARCVECGGYFCRICQVDLNHICMICRTPLFALSVEVDFEQFSSDEEFEALCARFLRRADQTTVKSKPKPKREHQSRFSVRRKP
ncbi:DC-STAMP domain-containing protein 2 [Paragonimus heterotremus]|uniref:DC-STAMP domain-containing protein 2 n=1 Tax=Paragonimus heterotremus TaxID=100268 RepID=A0A8J4T4C6_9TREM|nr:DC-STAMP domain-containing protein 2 [Paragonimus heterotremus]